MVCLINVYRLLQWKIKYKFKLQMDSDIIKLNGKLTIVRKFKFVYPDHILEVNSDEFMDELQKRIEEMDD